MPAVALDRCYRYADLTAILESFAAEADALGARHERSGTAHAAVTLR